MKPHFRTFGHGARAAVAIHCTLAHAGAWRGVAAALSKELTVTAIDLPGHGKNPAWDRRGDVQTACVESALPFLDAPADLIGHSFGATVALRLAVDFPQKVRSLTLIEPVFFAAAAADAPKAVEAHAQEAHPYQKALESGDTMQAARLFNRLWGDGTRWTDFRASARTYMADRMYFIPAQTPSIFMDNANLLAPGRLERADMPSVLIEGGKSPSIIRHINAAIARRLPLAQVVNIAQAGHMAPMTHPEEVAAAIRRLIEIS